MVLLLGGGRGHLGLRDDRPGRVWRAGAHRRVSARLDGRPAGAKARGRLLHDLYRQPLPQQRLPHPDRLEQAPPAGLPGRRLQPGGGLHGRGCYGPGAQQHGAGAGSGVVLYVVSQHQPGRLPRAGPGPPAVARLRHPGAGPHGDAAACAGPAGRGVSTHRGGAPAGVELCGERLAQGRGAVFK